MKTRRLLTVVRFLWILPPALLGLLFAGCATPSPINIAKDNFAACQAVKPQTADSHYAVLKWYADIYRHEDKDPASVAAARDGLKKAETAVREEWRRSLGARYGFLTASPASLAISGAEAAAAPEIRAALDAVTSGITLRPDLKICKGFSWINGLGSSSDFAAWLKAAELRLETKDTDAAVAAELRAALEERSKATLTEIKKLVTARKYTEAYAQLEEQQLVFRDTSAEADLNQARVEIAPLLLKAEITRVRAMGFAEAETHAAAKGALYEARTRWLADAALKQAFEQAAIQKEFAQLQRDIGSAQAALWCTEMDALAAKKHHWHLFLCLKDKLAAAEKYEKPVREGAEDGLWGKYLELLPQSLTHFAETAENEIEKGERHGNALIVYQMSREIGDFVKAAKREPDAKAVALLKDAAKREVRSQKFVRLFVARKFFIREIAPKDGLGTELKNDLTAEFSKLCQSSPILYGLEMGEDEMKVTPRDYVLDKGIYATLEADYGPGRAIQEIVTRQGEVEEQDNPEYLRLIRRKKDTAGIPPKLYAQATYKYTIERKITEAVANARLGFMLEFGDTKENHNINLKQSLRREFIQESIDPQKTVRETTPLSSRPADMGQKDPKPELRVDRVLTLLEMKEWARGETRKIAIMQILATLSAYPLELAAKADAFEKETNWQMAGNFLGICLEYCRNLKLDEEAKSPYFTMENPPDYLKDEYTRNAKLLKDLAALQKKLWERSVAAGVKYLEAE